MYPPFSSYGDNVAISASTTSANATLPGSDLTRYGETLRVYNATAAAAFFRTSTTAGPTAVTTDMFIAPGSTEVFCIGAAVIAVAVILASGTGTVYFQRGGGQ